MRKVNVFRLSVLATAAIACSASPVFAQGSVRNLDREPSDVRTYKDRVDGGTREFDVTLAAGKSLRIEVEAAPGSSLDPYLKVTDRNTGEVLAENDDGPNGLGSLAMVFAETARNLRLEVSQTPVTGSDVSGDFEITLRPSDYRPQPPRQIANNTSETGTLVSGESHQFLIEAQPGQVWIASLDAADGSNLDPVLDIYSGSGAIGAKLASDDDGGEGLNARLRFAVSKPGTYTLVARDYSQGEGAYVLRLGNAPVATAGTIHTVGFDEPVAGNIGTSGGAASVFTYRLSESAIGSLEAEPGLITISMETLGGNADDDDDHGGIDPKLEIGFDTSAGFATLASDDDGGEGLNSLLSVDLSGVANDRAMLERLRIKASSIGGQAGAFTVSVSRNNGFILLGDESSAASDAGVPSVVTVPGPPPRHPHTD